jgi:hypothetical protein
MNISRPRAHAWRRHLFAVAAYALVSILFSWPLARHIDSHLPGSPDGDTGLYVWNLWVFQHELLEERTMPYFTGRIFAATGRANLSLHNYTAFANLLALPLVRPLGVVATFNLVYLGLTVLTAYAMFLLALRLVNRDAGVSWLAGLLFAWSPVLTTRGMGHFSLVAAAPLPIFVLLLIRTGERRSNWDAAAIGATVAWATACDVYYGVFCVMLAASYLTASSIRISRSEPWTAPRPHGLMRAIDLVAISLAGLVVALLVSQGWQFTVLGRVIRIRTIYTPVLVLTILVATRLVLQYRPAIRSISLADLARGVRILGSAGVVSAILMSPLLYAFGVRVREGRFAGAPIYWRSSPPGVDLLALLTPNPNHPLAPAALGEWVSRFSRDGYLENVASIPLVAIAILLISLRRGWRPPTVAAALAIGFGLLALGPFVRVGGIDTHVPAPWALLRYLPIVGLARSPGRFFIFAMVGIAVLFASALHALISRHPRARTTIVAGVGMVLAFELLPAPRQLFSAEIPSIYRIIAAEPREVRVLELPFGIRDGTMAVGNFTSRTQFYQTAHEKPILGGYLSRVSQRRVRENQRHPVLSSLMRLSEGESISPRQLEVLREEWPAFVKRNTLGYVVLDRDRSSAALQSIAAQQLGLQKLAEDGALALYRPAEERARP